jgi:trehalose 6-phosphate phosphatase
MRNCKNDVPVLRCARHLSRFPREILQTMRLVNPRLEDRDDLPAPPRADIARIALFVDVDGTLLDFAARPDAVLVDASLRALLRAVRDRLDGALAPLSGRRLREVDALLDLGACAAAGLHGAELRTLDGQLLATPANAQLQRARARATELAAAIPGILVEDKGAAIALHYRAAPQVEATVRRAAAEMLELAGPNHALQRGQFVIELKPANADKGSALAALMRTPPFTNRTPWMIGDDLTDEDAFAAANVLGGVSVIVGPRRPTLARHALATPAAARAWIAALLDNNEMTAGASQ